MQMQKKNFVKLSRIYLNLNYAKRTLTTSTPEIRRNKIIRKITYDGDVNWRPLVRLDVGSQRKAEYETPS